MALGVGNSSPGWKISIEDDGFIKIWLTWYLTNREISKKLAKTANKKVDIYIYIYISNARQSRVPATVLYTTAWGPGARDPGPGTWDPGPGPGTRDPQGGESMGGCARAMAARSGPDP